MQDFGELMKDTRLAPAADASHLEELPLERGREPPTHLCVLNAVLAWCLWIPGDDPHSKLTL